MNRKLIFMMNPISGTSDKKRVKRLITRLTEQAGIDHEFVDTNREGSYPELEERIGKEGLEEIVAIGGDGTIRQLASALRHLPVRFGLVPMGSGNGLALAAGIPKDPAKAMEVIFKGDHAPVDAFLVNGIFSCMLTGIGFDAQVAHDFARQRSRGLITYVKVTAMNFFTAGHYPFRLRIGDDRIRQEAFFVSIANSNQFGNQFTIAPKANLNDGLVDVIVVRRMSRLKRIGAILYQLRFGEPQEDLYKMNDILYYQTSELSIENPMKAPVHIDGDPFPTAPVFQIKVIPSAFRLICPAQ